MNKNEKLIQTLLEKADVVVNGKRPFDIQVHDKRFYKKALSQRELGIGEAYMDGWWSSNQLDETVARLLSVNAREILPITPSIIKDVVSGTIKNHQKTSRAYKNAASHYDIGNDLYSLMLGKRMIYSCGFWQHAKNLDEAQEAKLDRICKKLYLKKGMTLLDIGCGWGGFAEFAAKNYGTIVTGITPAIEQVKLAKERTKGLEVSILQQDYREVVGKFDRIVSIGMLEHVGPKNYHTFFSKCNSLLNDNGLMLHHTIGNTRSTKAVDPWTNKYIFPGGVLPSLTQIARATERLLIIEDLENFGPDYDKTLLAWHKNFVSNYPKIQDNYDKRFYRMWEYYLLSCSGAFRARKIQLWQIVMSKVEPTETYRGYR
jgi:cyclopropane-fatty-acyl-phospholipid synthase